MFQISLIAAYIAGMVALFAPCCISYLFPAYLGNIFKERKQVLTTKDVLIKNSKRIKKNTPTRRDPKPWQRYLRALDARTGGISYAEIGLKLTNADNDEYPDPFISEGIL